MDLIPWLSLVSVAGLVHVLFPGVIEGVSQFEESTGSTG